MLRFIALCFAISAAVSAHSCRAENSSEGQFNSNFDPVPSVFFGEREAEVRPQPDAPSQAALKPPVFESSLQSPPEEYPALELPNPSEPLEFYSEDEDTCDPCEPCDCEDATVD